MDIEKSEEKYYPREFDKLNFTLRLVKSVFRQSTIDGLLNYFQTGNLKLPDDFKGELPRFVRPRLLAVRNHLLAIRTVHKYNHGLVPFVKEAFVTFQAFHQEADVPPWKEIQREDEYYSHGSVAYTFTSFLTIPENLVNFTLDVLSPGPLLQTEEGPTMEELMADLRQRRLKDIK